MNTVKLWALFVAYFLIICYEEIARKIRGNDEQK